VTGGPAIVFKDTNNFILTRLIIDGNAPSNNGVLLNNATGIIDNCIIQNSNIGINCNNSSSVLDTITITNCIQAIVIDGMNSPLQGENNVHFMLHDVRIFGIPQTSCP